jgi:hypothetical protein
MDVEILCVENNEFKKSCHYATYKLFPTKTRGKERQKIRNPKSEIRKKMVEAVHVGWIRSLGSGQVLNPALWKCLIRD